MPKFSVYARVVGTKYIGKYEAATADEAREKAEADAHVSLCHQCCEECDDPEIEELFVEPAEAEEDAET